MLFHSSLRKELARSFGATLVVLVTVVVTTVLIRTLGEASRGNFNPSDVMIVMGFTVLSDMPTILSMCLFIAILSVLNRMFRDSEMVIWFGSGRGLSSLIKPLVRFAWPIWIVVFTLAFFILPWALGRIEDFRDQYEKRGDLARIEPGQFQESANGDRVFFIEKNTSGGAIGSNVFIATHEVAKDTVTSAQSGRIENKGADRFLVLQNGQRLEKSAEKKDLVVSFFETYGARIGADDQSARSYVPTNSIGTLALLQSPSKPHWAELSWRAGLTLASINLVFIGLATAGVNPRVGRSANIGFAFMTFILYFNFLVLGKSWIQAGQVHFAVFLVALHGGAFILGMLLLFKRHNNWALHWRRPAPIATSTATHS